MIYKKLSIITVNLNNTEGLRKTIESVVYQTFTDFEYIIIDGGSTDESVEIIKQYADKITYWVSESDKGIYNAMNKGILQAKGEYCLFLNSGDYLVDENVLENMFSLDFKEDIVYGNRINIYENATRKEVKFPDKLKFSFFFKGALPHQATFFKKYLFDEIGGYAENYKYASDWLFYMLAFIKYKSSYRYIGKNIVYFDCTGISSDVNNRNEMFAEREYILKKEFPLLYDDYEELIKMRPLFDKRAAKIGKIILKPYRFISRLLKNAI